MDLYNLRHNVSADPHGAKTFAKKQSRFIPCRIEPVVMSILLLYVVQGFHLFHYGEGLAAFCQFLDLCKDRVAVHA